MRVTRHARRRLKQRAGVCKRNCNKSANDAVKYGLRASDLAGELRNYVEGATIAHGRNLGDVRVFRQKIYIFEYETLITVLNLPYKFHRTVEKLRHRKMQLFAAAA